MNPLFPPTITTGADGPIALALYAVSAVIALGALVYAALALWKLRAGLREGRAVELSSDGGATVGTACDFSGAFLVRADLRDCQFRGASFRGADLRRARLSGDYRDADFRDADVRGTDFRGADLRGADLSTAVFSRTTLGFGDLSGAPTLPDGDGLRDQ